MSRAFIRIIAIASVLVLFAPGVADAHVKSWATNVRLEVSSKNVKAGRYVDFVGNLTSKKHACIDHRAVKLVRAGNVVAKKKTNDNGGVHFRRRVHQTAMWWLKVPKKVLTNVHPHTHTCKRGESDHIKIKVHP